MFAVILACDLLAVVLYDRYVSSRIHAEAAFYADAGRTPMDAVVVFCNGIGPHEGVDTTTRERLREAARLVRTGAARAVAGIGCHWKVNENIPDGMARHLRRFGLSEDQIFIDEGSFDTTSNWIEARAIITREKWAHLFLLSSPLHLYRIGWLIQNETPPQELKALDLRPRPYTPPRADNFITLYRETHHEWTAWIARLFLPQSIFRGYLKWRRK